VLVGEPRGRNLRPGRDRPQLGALFLGQRAVQREELVVTGTRSSRLPPYRAQRR
jgi:hypothetical protein